MSRGLKAGLGLACALALGAAAPAGVGAAESKGKRVVRVRTGGAALGVSLGDVGADDMSRLRLSEEQGALVRDVEPDSPAAAAGLEKDDVIVGYQGERVHSAAQLARLVHETPAGREVSLEVSRGGSVQKMTAKLRDRRGEWPGDLDLDFDVPVPALPPRAPRPPKPPEPPRPGEMSDLMPEFGPLWRFGELWGKRPRLGVAFQELGDQLAAYFKVDGGLLVTNVNEDSPASRAGVKAGDVIQRINGKDVRSFKEFREELDRTEGGGEVTLGLQREGRNMEVKAKLPEAEPARRSEIRL